MKAAFDRGLMNGLRLSSFVLAFLYAPRVGAFIASVLTDDSVTVFTSR